MNEFESVTQAIQDSMSGMWELVITYIPVAIVAFLVLLAGLIISPLLGNIVRRFVRMTKMDSLAEQTGFIDQAKNAGISLSISGLVGGLVKWFFLIAFFVAAVDILGWERLTDVLYELLFFIPNVIVAVVILVAGLVLGNLLKQVIVKKIEASKDLMVHGQMIGKFAQWSVVVFATLSALYQLGIAQELIVVLFAGLVLTLSLAFGLGGRQKAAEIIEKMDLTKK
ncbi:MAG: mechanosensitive ion channel family protein [Patescibacteria group bacterium]